MGHFARIAVCPRWPLSGSELHSVSLFGCLAPSLWTSMGSVCASCGDLDGHHNLLIANVLM